MSEDLSLEKIRLRLKRPKIPISNSLIKSIEQSSIEIQRRIRGVLKGNPFEGKKISYTAHRKVSGLLLQPEQFNYKNHKQSLGRSTSTWMRRTFQHRHNAEKTF